MCKADFYEGYPLIDALVIFPAHLVSGETPPPLSFLIDTGADSTMISAADAAKLGIEYRLSAEGVSTPFFGGQPLRKGPNVGGVGGGIRSYEVKDVNLLLVTMLDEEKLELHEEHLDVLYVPEGGISEIPNLLGRDIICRFNMVWDSLKKTIDLTRAAIPGRWWISITQEKK